MLTDVQSPQPTPQAATAKRTAVWVDQPASANPAFDRLEVELKQAQRRRSLGVWALTLLIFGAIVGGFFVFAHETQTVDEPAVTDPHSVGHVFESEAAAPAQPAPAK